jgi:hypothetical protein
VEYLNYLDSTVTNDARRKLEIKYGIAMAKAASNRKETFHQ